MKRKLEKAYLFRGRENVMEFEDQNMVEFIAACEQQYCLWCGRPVIYAGTGRHGVFCPKRCRWAFDKHRQRERMKERE